jgi:hypothetical protein
LLLHHEKLFSDNYDKICSHVITFAPTCDMATSLPLVNYNILPAGEGVGSQFGRLEKKPSALSTLWVYILLYSAIGEFFSSTVNEKGHICGWLNLN